VGPIVEHIERVTLELQCFLKAAIVSETLQRIAYFDLPALP